MMLRLAEHWPKKGFALRPVQRLGVGGRLVRPLSVRAARESPPTQRVAAR